MEFVPVAFWPYYIDEALAKLEPSRIKTSFSVIHCTIYTVSKALISKVDLYHRTRAYVNAANAIRAAFSM